MGGESRVAGRKLEKKVPSIGKKGEAFPDHGESPLPAKEEKGSRSRSTSEKEETRMEGEKAHPPPNQRGIREFVVPTGGVKRPRLKNRMRISGEGKVHAPPLGQRKEGSRRTERRKRGGGGRDIRSVHFSAIGKRGESSGSVIPTEKREKEEMHAPYPLGASFLEEGKSIFPHPFSRQHRTKRGPAEKREAGA